ncbi:BrnT family toxin [Desulfococcaceae bacterium HSG9]|nr:BrnT family toxin [Desulfococcaceae bacterium HSG9]
MKFEWDELKNQENIKKHGFDFADAHKVFSLPMIVNMDDREDYGEERQFGIGFLELRVVVLIFAETDEQTIRIISFRKAIKDERKRFEYYYKNKFGAY